MHRRTAKACLLIALLTACSGKDSKKESTSPASTGPLTEAEFKALHELTTEQVPQRRGVMIDLAGSRAYLSLPANATTPMPGIVVIHEWWGLNQHIEHWADRLADDGYAALAVDLYGGKVAETPDDAMTLMKSVDEQRAKEIIAAAVAFLADDERIRATKRASIGWCFGGGWSLQAALADNELDAAVIYYGRLVTDPQALGAIGADVLGVFANRDQGIPPDQVDAFAAGLEQANVRHEIYRYDADHAFANPSSARYDQTSATDAWDKVRTFLAAHLR